MTRPDVKLWLALWSEAKQAVKAERMPFTLVDLTAKLVCPPWMTQDMLSGTVCDKAQRMAGTCVICFQGMERTNGKKT